MKRSTCKHELKRLIVEQLVDEDVLPESCLEVYNPLPMDPSWQYEIRRLEIEIELRLKDLEAQAQQRKEELQAQRRKEELEAQQRKEELEARKEELEAQKYEKELELKHEREMKALKLKLIELPMKSPLLLNLIWVKMCDWYHLLMNQKLISTFNTLKE